jgi:hypothetical protein
MAAGGERPRKGAAVSREKAATDGEADSEAQRNRGPSWEHGGEEAQERRERKLSITDGRQTPKEEEAQEGNGRGETLNGLFIANGLGRCGNP